MKYAKKNKELEFDNAYLNSLFQNSLDGILVLDNEDRIVCSNDSFRRLFQYDEKEIRGHYVNDLIAGPDFQDAYEASRIALGGNTVVREVKRKRKDGQAVNVQVNGFPFMVNGVQQGILAVYEDTTVRIGWVKN
jgi:PAS domain S-box-containing protein